MDTLRITVVGQEIFKIVEEKLELAGFNKVNRANNGMLGNLKTLTLEFDIPEDKVIKKRAYLMNLMVEDNMRLMPMYVHGDWMRIFVFKPMRM